MSLDEDARYSFPSWAWFTLSPCQCCDWHEQLAWAPDRPCDCLNARISLCPSVGRLGIGAQQATAGSFFHAKQARNASALIVGYHTTRVRLRSQNTFRNYPFLCTGGLHLLVTYYCCRLRHAFGIHHRSFCMQHIAVLLRTREHSQRS